MKKTKVEPDDVLRLAVLKLINPYVAEVQSDSEKEIIQAVRHIPKMKVLQCKISKTFGDLLEDRSGAVMLNAEYDEFLLFSMNLIPNVDHWTILQIDPEKPSEEVYKILNLLVGQNITTPDLTIDDDDLALTFFVSLDDEVPF